MNVAIVGSGFGGIGMAVHLKRAGIPFVVLEKSSSLGGAWRDNAYPGSACDVRAELYAFSFATRTNWPHAYGSRDEILAYLEAVARAFELGPHLRFGRDVCAASFDEARGRWRVDTAGGEQYEASVLVSAVGLFSEPEIPPLPGLDAFAGAHFHAGRWPAGADASGSVAVIGTGATAVGLVPAIARGARRVYVFQRTPPYVLPKGNRAVAPRPARFRRLRRAVLFLRAEARGVAFTTLPAAMRLGEAAFYDRVRRAFPDARLRAALRPAYRLGRKRVLLSDEYYAALRRENVHLVTTPIERLQAGSVVTTDGAERPVDTVVFATGFRPSAFLASLRITGRDGCDLHETWRTGASAYLGMTVPGFPNLFLLYGPNTNLGHTSVVLMLEHQMRYVMRALAAMRRLGLRSVDARPELARAFEARVRRAMARTIWRGDGETWYRDVSGKATVNWPESTLAYGRATRRFEPADYRLDSRAE